MPKRKERWVGGIDSGQRQVPVVASTTVNDRYHLMAILSPAKTMNFDPLDEDTPISWTKPSRDNHNSNTIKCRQIIISAMQKHSQTTPNKLCNILNVSTTLAEKAKQYWMSMNAACNYDDDYKESKPCGFAFDGAAYKGLDIHSLSASSVSYLQNHVRIVDPLYGWLRPMDAIVPYRLEMASRGVLDDKGKNGKSQRLAEFWKPSIFQSIQFDEVQLQKESWSGCKILLINLASDEYSAAVEWPKPLVVKIVFRHAGRVIAVHAKRARGLMVRYMAEHNITTLNELAKFDLEGYAFQPSESSSLLLPNNTSISDDDSSPVLVFDRSAGNASANKKTKKKK
jgi:uncharacterized protein